MSSELKPAGLEFGTIIAIVAPGFLAFHALSYHMTAAKAWLDAATTKDQSVGVFLIVLLASIS